LINFPLTGNCLFLPSSFELLPSSQELLKSQRVIAPEVYSAYLVSSLSFPCTSLDDVWSETPLREGAKPSFRNFQLSRPKCVYAQSIVRGSHFFDDCLHTKLLYEEVLPKVRLKYTIRKTLILSSFLIKLVKLGAGSDFERYKFL